MANHIREPPNDLSKAIAELKLLLNKCQKHISLSPRSL